MVIIIYGEGMNGMNVEDVDINKVYNPNNVNKYVFEKSKCKKILDMVFGNSTTVFLLN